MTCALTGTPQPSPSSWSSTRHPRRPSRPAAGLPEPEFALNGGFVTTIWRTAVSEEPGREPVTDPVTDLVTDPVTDLVTDPVERLILEQGIIAKDVQIDLNGGRE